MYTVATRYSGRLALARPLFALASVVPLLLLAALMLRPGSYLTSGNLHDILIPYNSALAAVQGLTLHQDFHTPFGWVYSRLNHLGWWLIGASGGLFVINDLIVVTALVWSMAVLGGFLLMAFSAPPSGRSAWLKLWLVGQFIVFTAFNFRGLSSFSVQDITWYGTYNNHLWALVFLQLSSLSLCLRTTPGAAMQRHLIWLQPLCVALSFNYKISFGIASMLLAVAVVLIDWPGWRWRIAYAVSLLMSVLAVSVLLAPDNYAYASYFNDIGYALQAKAEKTARPALLSPLACFTLVIAVLLWQRSGGCAGSLIDALKKPAHRGELTRTLLLGAMLAAGVTVGIAGDYARPHHYMVVSVAILVLLGPRLPVRGPQRTIVAGIAVTGLAALLLLNLQTNARIARHKTIEQYSGRYLPVHFDTPYGRLAWVVDATSSYDYLMRTLRLDGHPDFPEIVAHLAYPAYEGRRTIPPVFLNADYAGSLQAAKRMTESLPGIRRLNVVMLEFTNPMPMLLGSPVPTDSFHWLHFGTSVPGNDEENRIRTQWQGADVVIIPAAAVDGYSQWLMNCKFLTWNEKQARPFTAFAADRFHLYYSRERFGPPLADFGGPQLAQRCEDLLAKYRAGLLKP